MSAVLHRQSRRIFQSVTYVRYVAFGKTSTVQFPIRYISTFSPYYSRIPPGKKKPPLILHTEKQTQAAEEHEDPKTRAQLFLEESAAPVVVEDMEKSKAIIEHGSYDTFMLMVITRLHPILVYCLHHDPVEFLDGFAYSESAMGRAREASLWLFISAHAWFTRAAAYNAPLLIPLSEDVLSLAELFDKAGKAVENYVEKKESGGAAWYDVGSMILECAHQAWEILPDDIGLFEKDGQATEKQRNQASTGIQRAKDLELDFDESTSGPSPVSEEPQVDVRRKLDGDSKST